MASVTNHRHLPNGNGRGGDGIVVLNGSATRNIDKTPSPLSATPNPPPSPPTTESETESDGTHTGPNYRLQSDAPGMQHTRLETGTISASENGSPVISPITSPPYWLSHHTGHARTFSNTSVESIPTGGITMQDNESSSFDERGSACWAKSVAVTDYVTVNGSATNIGAFVVWNVRVETLNGSFMNIRKRYSEFDDFRWRLMRTFPGFEAAVPELPPKSLISKFRPSFLEKRRAGLQYFLNCIMLNPEFSGSPVLKEFLFT